MVLRRVSARAGETTVQHAQLLNADDVEAFPAARRPAAALAANLEGEQALDAVADTVVVRLGDAELSDSAHELDEAFLFDRANQIVIHAY